MTRIARTIMGLVLAFIPTATAIPAPACPEVDSARAMLVKAAAAQNDRELQAPRNKDAQAPREQGARQDQPPPAPGKQDTVSPEMKRAAVLVKEADTDCQAGNTAEAARKAKAAMALMQQ